MMRWGRRCDLDTFCHNIYHQFSGRFLVGQTCAGTEANCFSANDRTRFFCRLIGIFLVSLFSVSECGPALRTQDKWTTLQKTPLSNFTPLLLVRILNWFPHSQTRCGYTMMRTFELGSQTLLEGPSHWNAGTTRWAKLRHKSKPGEVNSHQ